MALQSYFTEEQIEQFWRMAKETHEQTRSAYNWLDSQPAMKRAPEPYVAPLPRGRAISFDGVPTT